MSLSGMQETYILTLVPVRQSLFYFSGAGKFRLAHGLRQLIRDVKSDVRILNFRSDVTYSLKRKTPNDGVECRYAT